MFSQCKWTKLLFLLILTKTYFLQVRASFGPLFWGCFHVCDLIMDGCKKIPKVGTKFRRRESRFNDGNLCKRMNYGRESLASGWGVEVGTWCFEANIHTRKKREWRLEQRRGVWPITSAASLETYFTTASRERGDRTCVSPHACVF